MTSTPQPGGPVPRPTDPDVSGTRSAADLRADVAAAVAELDGLADRPVGDHVAVYERLHTVLGEALAAGPDRT